VADERVVPQSKDASHMGDIDARNHPSSGTCDMVDTSEKWGSPEFHKRQLIRQEEERQQEVQEQQENYDAWNEWADTKIAVALDKFNTEFSDAVVDLMFERMDKHKKAAETETNHLKTAVAELRGEMNLLRELLKGNVKDIGLAIRKYVA
jgi:hypothetical protein